MLYKSTMADKGGDGASTGCSNECSKKGGHLRETETKLIKPRFSDFLKKKILDEESGTG